MAKKKVAKREPALVQKTVNAKRRAELGEELVRVVRELVAAKAEKKRIARGWSAEISELAERANQIAVDLDRGFEMIETQRSFLADDEAAS